MIPVLRSCGLLAAFIIGFSVPQLHVFAWLIPWAVRMMIFIVFLQCDFHEVRPQPSHWRILVFNLAAGPILCALFRYWGQDSFASAAWFLAAAPTATSASAVMGFLGGKVEYVVTSFLLSTLIVSLSIPFILPWAVGQSTPGAWIHVAGSVASTVLAPIVLALVVRFIVPSIGKWVKQCQNIVFIFWVVTISIICSNASYFISTEPNISTTIVLEMGMLALVVCIMNFVAGYILGETNNRHASSQSLGQKNTSITIFLAMEYANPLIALGPTLYVLWHNLWNAWQLRKPPEKKEQE